MPGTAGKVNRSPNEVRDVGAPGCARLSAAEDDDRAEGVAKFVVCCVGTLPAGDAAGTLAACGATACASNTGAGTAVPSTAAGGVADGEAGGAGGFGVV